MMMCNAAERLSFSTALNIIINVSDYNCYHTLKYIN